MEIIEKLSYGFGWFSAHESAAKFWISFFAVLGVILIIGLIIETKRDFFRHRGG